MKEYQYSIIRRESRNPKRHRKGRGVSQSDLEALKNELEGNNKDTDLIISDIRDSIRDLDSLSVSIEDFASSANDIKQRLAGAEGAIAGKLDSSAFDKFKVEDFKGATDRLTTAEGAISNKLDTSTFDKFKEEDYKHTTDRLTTAEGAISGKLDSSSFDNWKSGDYSNRQSDIDKLLAGKQAAGNYLSQEDFDKFKKGLTDTADDTKKELDNLKSNYKVVVSKRGEIRNGKVYDGVDYNGSTAILHTAQIYTLFGEDATVSQGRNLTWTVNKGRTTAPLERTVTGVACYVTEADFVYNQFDLHHYDIQLDSNFTAQSNP